MVMKSLSIYYHKFLNRWYQKVERSHPIALKELRLRPSEMGKGGAGEGTGPGGGGGYFAGDRRRDRAETEDATGKGQRQGIGKEAFSYLSECTNLPSSQCHGLSRPLYPKWTLHFGFHLSVLVQADK